MNRHASSLPLRFVVAAFATGLLLGAPCVRAVSAEGDARPVMRSIFAELSVLLPRAVAGELGEPGVRAEVRSALDGLQRGADALALHGERLGAGSRLLTQPLAQSVHRARGFFERGEFGNAAYAIEWLVDDCIACHDRRPSGDATLTAGFARDAERGGAAPLQLAAIEVATRRFEDAAARYEAVFGDPDAMPEALLGPLRRYLIVAVRVLRDPARAEKTLRRLASHPDVASGVRADLTAWADALASLAPADLEPTTRAAARSRLARVTATARFAGDPRPLVGALVVSAQLHALVARPHPSPEAAAEVHALLGDAELAIAQNAWQTRADLHWETAIRLAPRSATARAAFATLERETRAGFTGSGGFRLPPEEAKRLEALRRLALGDGALPFAGAELFADHCALCHGVRGDGNGPYREQLMWRPADLTRIARRNGGAFPEEKVFALVARRDPLGAHQSPEMPRWGEFWQGDGRIHAIVQHLRSIQQ